jgi:photosystem II stability/assembly factor-like uncharacterized protein
MMNMSPRLFVLFALSLPAVAQRIQWSPLNEPGSGGWLTAIAASPHDSQLVLMGGDMLGAAYSTDGGESWQASTGFASYEHASFTFHPTNPEIIWAGTMSGPYRSLDRGRTWTSQRQGLPSISGGSYSAPVQVVLFDPAEEQHLLALGGSHRVWNSPGSPRWGAVWESTDGGQSWTLRGTVAGGRNIVAAVWTSTAVYAAVREAGIFRSGDHGATWIQVRTGLPSLNIRGLVAHPTEPDRLYAAFDSSANPAGGFLPGGIFETTDGGETWQPRLSGLSQNRSTDRNQTSRYENIAISASDPRVLITSDTGYCCSAIFRSSDEGRTWQRVVPGRVSAKAYPAGPGATVLSIDPGDPLRFYAATSEYTLRSTDGGDTWVDVTSQPGDSAGLFRGRGFSGLVSTNFVFHPTNENWAALLAMDDGKFWQSRDDLRNWQWLGRGVSERWGGGNDVTVAGPSNETLYVTIGQSGNFDAILKSTDGGDSWRTLRGAARGLPERYARAHPLGIYALPADPNRVWVTIGGKLYRSVDGGERWSVVHEGPGMNWIAARSDQPLNFFVGSPAGVYQTVDGGSFQLMAGSPQGVDRIRLSEADPGTLFAMPWRAARGGLWRYRDGEWTRLRNDTFIRDVSVDRQSPNRIAVITDDHPYHDATFATGVWLSEDGGETWSSESHGLPMLRGSVIRFDPHRTGRVVIGLGGRGFWVGALN